MGDVLKISEIKSSVEKVAKEYPIERVSLFGSYADGTQTAGSDIDLLVKFNKPVGLFTLIGFQMEIEELVGKKVDVVSTPIPKDSLLVITNEVPIYG